MDAQAKTRVKIEFTINERGLYLRSEKGNFKMEEIEMENLKCWNYGQLF